MEVNNYDFLPHSKYQQDPIFFQKPGAYLVFIVGVGATPFFLYKTCPKIKLVLTIFKNICTQNTDAIFTSTLSNTPPPETTCLMSKIKAQFPL